MPQICNVIKNYMKVSLNCASHKSNVATQSTKKQDLQNLLDEVLNEKGISTKLSNSWLDDQTLDTDTIPPLALHSFLLKAESMGFGFTTEKKVTVTFE